MSFLFLPLEFAAEAKPEFKKIYDTANWYHFVHTLALMGVPLTKRPVLVGANEKTKFPRTFPAYD